MQRGVNPAKISVQPNGIDLLNSDLVSGQNNGRSKSCFTMGYIGSFYRYEGLDLLIDAMHRLRNSDQQYKLVLVGGYEEEKNLRKKVGELHLEDTVHFTGPVPHSEIAKYYSSMDLLVFPRRRQRLTELVTPLKPLEAMCYGKTVLASDVGGHKELIQHGDNGLLFKADDQDELLRQIQADARQEYDLPQMANRALNHVATTRNWAEIVKGYLKIYDHLLQ